MIIEEDDSSREELHRIVMVGFFNGVFINKNKNGEDLLILKEKNKGTKKLSIIDRVKFNEVHVTIKEKVIDVLRRFDIAGENKLGFFG